MATSITALSEKFYKDFHDQYRAISDAIDADTQAHSSKKTDINVEKYRADLNELQRKVQDANVFTNSHDQRTYATEIKNLQDKIETLRDLVNPKKKFSFKSARKTTSIQNKAPNDTNSILESNAGKERDTSIKVNIENLLEIGNRPFEYKNFSLAAEGPSSSSTTSIQNASASVVDLTQHPLGELAGLHIINIKSSIIFCGSVSGGLHITNVRDSIIVAQTHQFRMHQCTNVVVYLAAGSSPIIENCSQIKFAPLEMYSGKSSTNARNAWNEVSDFQYPGLVGESPNWSIVPEVERVAVGRTVEGGAMLQGVSVNKIAQLSELKGMLNKCAVPTLGTEVAAEEDHILEKILK